MFVARNSGQRLSVLVKGLLPFTAAPAAECAEAAVNTERVLNHDGFLSLNTFHKEAARDFCFDELLSSPCLSGFVCKDPQGRAVCLWVQLQR